jgi:predicted Zn-dependent protease
MKNHTKSVIITLLSVYSLSSCATYLEGVSERFQDLGNRYQQTVTAFKASNEDIDPVQEYYIGRAVAASILSNYSINNKYPVLTRYLNHICQTLVINSPRPGIYNGYHVTVLDSDEINAFATSGGHVFVTAGLIKYAKSEDELAAVLAHEIAHIQLQHSITAIKANRKTNAILTATSNYLEYISQETSFTDIVKDFNEVVSEGVNTLVNNGYSQSQEFDADKTALALLAGSGYQPVSLLDMLQVLKENQPNHPGGFNKTHPSPERRISNVTGYVNSYKVTDTRLFREQRFRDIMSTVKL